MESSLEIYRRDRPIKADKMVVASASKNVDIQNSRDEQTRTFLALANDYLQLQQFNQELIHSNNVLQQHVLQQHLTIIDLGAKCEKSEKNIVVEQIDKISDIVVDKISDIVDVDALEIAKDDHLFFNLDVEPMDIEEDISHGNIKEEVEEVVCVLASSEEDEEDEEVEKVCCNACCNACKDAKKTQKNYWCGSCVRIVSTSEEDEEVEKVVEKVCCNACKGTKIATKGRYKIIACKTCLLSYHIKNDCANPRPNSNQIRGIDEWQCSVCRNHSIPITEQPRKRLATKRRR
jgi:hypothetical protein